MKILLAVMLCGCVLLQDGPSSAEEKPQFDCGNKETQMEMNACAQEEYDAADKVLNDQWKLTRKAMADWDKELEEDQRGAETALLQAQRAWITYRDNQCIAEGFQARGGTLETMLNIVCLTRMTKNRTQELKDLAEPLGQ
ncbi:lysozyme inhibitor LprI family protein [Rhizobium helianthi]|uniref:Lysozyme inhibitor LprI family protein n=1 Tax=Rhizobium helianthi TaxID=1132695 RepID=A0ABW4M2U3_9HYPH